MSFVIACWSRFSPVTNHQSPITNHTLQTHKHALGDNVVFLEGRVFRASGRSQLQPDRPHKHVAGSCSEAQPPGAASDGGTGIHTNTMLPSCKALPFTLWPSRHRHESSEIRLSSHLWRVDFSLGKPNQPAFPRPESLTAMPTLSSDTRRKYH